MFNGCYVETLWIADVVETYCIYFGMVVTWKL